jgi:hypothetical protein
LIEFAEIADDEDVRLHYRIDLRIGFPGLRQAHVEGSDVGLPGFALQSQPDLMIQLSYDFLMRPRRRGWLSHVRDPIDELTVLIFRPCEVVSVRVA